MGFSTPKQRGVNIEKYVKILNLIESRECVRDI